MEQVINNFIDELNARIEIFSNSDDNLDSSKVDQIENIIDKYGVLDSKIFSKYDLDYILEIIGCENNNNYEEIDNIIKEYIDSFNKARSGNMSTSESITNTYNKYINLLTDTTIDINDIDYDELDELMSEAGLSIPDKWKIIAYLNNKCIKLNENKILALNLNTKLFLYNKLYLDNKDLTEYINNSIQNMNIDIDMIPSLAKKIAGESYDVNKVKNALSTIILNELYKQLTESNDKETLENLQEMVENALYYIDNYDDKVINPIKNIVLDYDDILTEEINKGHDINTYMDISIDDIEKLVSDHDKAITLKKLPIIKSMKDTLNSIEECDKTSDEYINYLNLLSDLNEAYQGIK